MRALPLACILLVLAGGGLVAQIVVQAPPQATEHVIRQTIDSRIDVLLAAQTATGSFEPGQTNLPGYSTGCTALAVLALETTLPHLREPRASRVRAAVDKGIAYIVNSPFECRTYSAALAIAALYKASPTRYQPWIATYADMLCRSQAPGGNYLGMWHYYLLPPNNKPHRSEAVGKVAEWGDNSNTQIAILGLYYAYRAGLPIPRRILQNTEKHYQLTQNKDGGWGYKDDVRPLSYESMTVAGVITLNLCRELLHISPKDCAPMPPDKSIENGFAWLDGNLNYKSVELYGLYTIERLGILMGQRELHDKDWFAIGAEMLVNSRDWPTALVDDRNAVVGTAFGLLFLARGLEPIIVYKLKHDGDWDNCHYDAKHLTEYVSDRFQQPKQWRIIDLKASQEVLNSVPILFLNGKKALVFTAEQKAKLKAYVVAGGTVVAMACPRGQEFDKSFRELAAELWPERKLEPVPDTDLVFKEPRPIGRKVKVEALLLPDRRAVFYFPESISCEWHRWTKNDEWALDLGANLYFYVERHKPPLPQKNDVFAPAGGN